MKTLPARHNPLSILIIALSSLAIFTFWLITVIVPVTIVELRYQYKSILQNIFHATSIRGIILPQFRIDTAVNTTNGIVIPALFIDEPIVYNVDPNDKNAYMKALKSGIAHAAGTSLPGTSGLGYFFAHSSTPLLVRQYNAVFYLLNKLTPTDPIFLYRDGERYTYRVSTKRMTKSSDVSFVSDIYPAETIVLQTCWPPGTTLERLLVFAKRVNN